MTGKEIREIFNARVREELRKSTIPWEELSDGRKKVWEDAAADINAVFDRLSGKSPAERYAYKGEPRKVLISPGFGAGWSTWNSDYRHEFLFDPEIIAAVESFVPTGDSQKDRLARSEHIGMERNFENSIVPGTPLANFHERMMLEHGDDYHGYYGGADDLEVRVIDGEFMVDEYDGSESITLRSEDDGWI